MRLNRHGLGLGLLFQSKENQDFEIFDIVLVGVHPRLLEQLAAVVGVVFQLACKRRVVGSSNTYINNSVGGDIVAAFLEIIFSSI